MTSTIISTATKDIEEADLNRGLLSERTLKLCPQEIPKCAGGPPPHGKDNTAMYASRELLCKGTQRKYPTTNSIFHSPNYARQQGTLDLRRQSNEACRICKLLEKEGRPREKLYTNHFGNLPTHCPHWTNMNSAEKKKTAKAANTACSAFPQM